MPQTITIRRTTSVNPPATLQFGELAWSENGTLYIGRAGGAVASLAIVSGITRTASEALFAGAFVNFWNNSGTESMRLANAALNRPAEAFVNQAIASGATGLAIIARGTLNNQAQIAGGGTIATGTYYLSGVEGGKISPNLTAEASGQLNQKVAIASGRDLIVTLGDTQIRG